MRRSVFADVLTTSYEHPRFPRFFPGDPTEVTNAGPFGSLLKDSEDSDDVPGSQSPITGRLLSRVPGFPFQLAVGFGIVKAICEGERVRAESRPHLEDPEA
jgi:hypothetical protein